jgi:hypothetical protein
MADDFNPYHVWLGIPPEEQPASHYRLLGIKPFETSGDVIDNAADRQMAHLRTIQVGKHVDLSQRLLNEVAAGRICLLDPKKRAAYDQQLRAKLAATAAPAVSGAELPAASGSAIQRQPPRRPTDAAPATSIPMAATGPQPADQWDDLLGKPDAKPSTGAGRKSAKSAATKRGARTRNISIGIAIGVVLIAAAAFGIYSLNSPSEGTLVFEWTDRADVSVTVDNAPVEVPAAGLWEHNFSAGPHHIVAQRPAFKFATDVNLAAGQRLSVSPDWKPKAVLVLSWPAGLRSGAVLKIDGRVQSISQHDPLEVPVEPGRHTIQITRPGSDPIGMSALVAADGRELVSVAAPRAEAKLVFDWPAGERKDAELIVDGSSRTIADGSDSEPFALTLEPGRHVVHITRHGFEPFNQAIDLSAGTDGAIKPKWTPEQKSTAPTIADTPVPVEVAPQPVKKLPAPAAAEQERIAKQLNDLYKTSQPGPKDTAKAQELYNLAAKDDSSPAERYMLLLKGAEIAATAGDLNLALSGVDTLAADYEIDALEAKQKLLEKFINAAKPEDLASAIPTAEQLVDQAVATDRYDLAIVLATTASHAATKSKIATHKEIEDRLSHRRRDIRAIEPIYAAAKKAQETLGKNPTDPEANLTVGRWLCFYKGDWSAGLPMLANGSDEKLKTLAEQEIKAPTDADEQARIADAWWDLAQKEAGVARDSVHLHAGEIYQAATPNLTSALKKAAIEKRLAEIANLKQPGPAANMAMTVGQSAGATKFRMGQWVDLLKLTDIVKDAERGNWSRRGVEVSCEPEGTAVLKLPAAIDGGYDLEVDFTRSDGDQDVDCLIPIGSHHCAVMLSGYAQEGGISALETIDGHYADQSENPTVMRPGKLENGHRYRLVISVRLLAADQASVDVTLDGARYLPNWTGGRASLGARDQWTLLNPRYVGFGVLNSRVTFYSARLRMVSGHASTDASVAEPAAPQVAPAASVSDSLSVPAKLPLGKAIDLLADVDIQRDATKGRWMRQGGAIASDDPMAKIAFPTEIAAANYELRVEFSRDKGDDSVAVCFPVGDRGTVLVLSNFQGKYSGLETVDGRRADGPRNPTTRGPSVLQDGKRYVVRIVVKVQRERARVVCFLDNKELVAWKGNVNSLDQYGIWRAAAHRAGMGEYHSPVTIYSASYSAQSQN